MRCARILRFSPAISELSALTSLASERSRTSASARSRAKEPRACCSAKLTVVPASTTALRAAGSSGESARSRQAFQNCVSSARRPYSEGSASTASACTSWFACAR